MTTKVTIAANCPDDYEVKVSITDNGDEVDEFTLQDGETADRDVHGDLAITVQEVPK